jgi:hypothetical protein
MSSPAATRSCPACGATNSNVSLFCAECGSSLNAPDRDALFRPSASTSGSQDTAAFIPATSGEAGSDREATRPAPAIRSTVQPYAPNWDDTPETDPWPGSSEPVAPLTGSGEPESMRGFFLGLVATLLILAVLGAWAWAAVLDDGARDAIRDLFGFLG